MTMERGEGGGGGRRLQRLPVGETTQRWTGFGAGHGDRASGGGPVSWQPPGVTVRQVRIAHEFDRGFLRRRCDSQGGGCTRTAEPSGLSPTPEGWSKRASFDAPS